MKKDKEITLITNEIVEDAEKRLKHLFPDVERVPVVLLIASPAEVGQTYLTSNLEIGAAKMLMALNAIGEDTEINATKKTKG